ncbi:uncharacterized protein LOC142228795 isoform X3 [Haematobia irritans]
MSNICRLCRKSSNDSLRLCDAKGNPNKIYNITKKYFHEKYLKAERRSSNPISVLCMECWRHISDFNTFQQTVLLLLDNLISEEEQPASPITEPTVSQVFLETSSIKVEESTNVITIPDDPEDELIEVKPTPSNDLGLGQLIVTDCSIQFSTSMENNGESTHYYNGFQINENIESQENGEAYHMEDTTAGGGDDHFILHEYDEKFEQETHDSDGSNYLLSEQKDSQERKSSSEMDAIIAKWKPYLDCYLCPKKYPNIISVKKHFEKEHPSDEFFIACCGRRIKYRFRLQMHASFHLDPQTVGCKECGKCFKSQTKLDHHVYLTHSDEAKTNNYVDKCKICSKSFRYRSGVYQHMKFNHPKEFAQRTQKRKSRKLKDKCTQKRMFYHQNKFEFKN